VLSSGNHSKPCGPKEEAFSFIGRVGTVTSVPEDKKEGTYGVTFNNGRSSYQFYETDLIMDNPPYNYEV